MYSSSLWSTRKSQQTKIKSRIDVRKDVIDRRGFPPAFKFPRLLIEGNLWMHLSLIVLGSRLYTDDTFLRNLLLANRAYCFGFSENNCIISVIGIFLSCRVICFV